MPVASEKLNATYRDVLDQLTNYLDGLDVFVTRRLQDLFNSPDDNNDGFPDELWQALVDELEENQPQMVSGFFNMEEPTYFETALFHLVADTRNQILEEVGPAPTSDPNWVLGSTNLGWMYLPNDRDEPPVAPPQGAVEQWQWVELSNGSGRWMMAPSNDDNWSHEGGGWKYDYGNADQPPVDPPGPNDYWHWIDGTARWVRVPPPNGDPHYVWNDDLDAWDYDISNPDPPTVPPQGRPSDWHWIESEGVWQLKMPPNNDPNWEWNDEVDRWEYDFTNPARRPLPSVRHDGETIWETQDWNWSDEQARWVPTHGTYETEWVVDPNSIQGGQWVTNRDGEWQWIEDESVIGGHWDLVNALTPDPNWEWDDVADQYVYDWTNRDSPPVAPPISRNGGVSHDATGTYRWVESHGRWERAPSPGHQWSEPANGWVASGLRTDPRYEWDQETGRWDYDLTDPDLPPPQNPPGGGADLYQWVPAGEDGQMEWSKPPSAHPRYAFDEESGEWVFDLTGFDPPMPQPAFAFDSHDGEGRWVPRPTPDEQWDFDQETGEFVFNYERQGDGVLSPELGGHMGGQLVWDDLYERWVPTPPEGEGYVWISGTAFTADDHAPGRWVYRDPPEDEYPHWEHGGYWDEETRSWKYDEDRALLGLRGEAPDGADVEAADRLTWWLSGRTASENELVTVSAGDSDDPRSALLVEIGDLGVNRDILDAALATRGIQVDRAGRLLDLKAFDSEGEVPPGAAEEVTELVAVPWHPPNPPPPFDVLVESGTRAFGQLEESLGQEAASALRANLDAGASISPAASRLLGAAVSQPQPAAGFGGVAPPVEFQSAQRPYVPIEPATPMVEINEGLYLTATDQTPYVFVEPDVGLADEPGSLIPEELPGIGRIAVETPRLVTFGLVEETNAEAGSDVEAGSVAQAAEGATEVESGGVPSSDATDADDADLVRQLLEVPGVADLLDDKNIDWPPGLEELQLVEPGSTMTSGALLRLLENDYFPDGLVPLVVETMANEIEGLVAQLDSAPQLVAELEEAGLLDAFLPSPAPETEPPAEGVSSDPPREEPDYELIRSSDADLMRDVLGVPEIAAAVDAAELEWPWPVVTFGLVEPGTHMTSEALMSLIDSLPDAVVSTILMSFTGVDELAAELVDQPELVDDLVARGILFRPRDETAGAPTAPPPSDFGGREGAPTAPPASEQAGREGAAPSSGIAEEFLDGSGSEDEGVVGKGSGDSRSGATKAEILSGGSVKGTASERDEASKRDILSEQADLADDPPEDDTELLGLDDEPTSGEELDQLPDDLELDDEVQDSD